MSARGQPSSQKKTPGIAAGGERRAPDDRGSGQEVALDTEGSGPDAFVREGVEARSHTARSAIRPNLRTAVRGVDRLVEHFDTDIEIRMRVPDGPRTGLPPTHVRVALRARSPAIDEPARLSGGRRVGEAERVARVRGEARRAGAHQRLGGAAVANPHETALEGRVQLRCPEVLPAHPRRPRVRHVDAGAVGIDVVDGVAEGDMVAIAGEEVGAGALDHVADRAVTVLGSEGQGIALEAEEVGQEEAGRTGPAVGVTGMTLDDGVSHRGVGRVDRVVVIAAAVVVESAADGCITPGLVDAQVDHAVPEVSAGVVDGLTGSERTA